MFDCLRPLFAKETQWVCGGVEELSTRFPQRSVTGSKVCKESHIRTIVNRFAAPYISNVHDLASGGSVSVLRMRGVLASASANSLLEIPLWRGTHRRVVRML